MAKVKYKNMLFCAIMLSFVFLLSMFTVGCDKNPTVESKIELSACGLIHEPEFGGIYIKSTIDDFNALGFKYGDSVKITFSNGYEMTDIPYYNGYYTKTGEPLLIAYPGYDYIKAAINNGDDLWDVAGLIETEENGLLSQQKIEDGWAIANERGLGTSVSERNCLWNSSGVSNDTTATITLYERGKYLNIQDARDIHYLDDRTLYPSDEVFANFRSLKGGRLKDNFLYRSASPCDNQHGRASYVDDLMERAEIKHIINLADSDAKIQGYMVKEDFNSDYFATLYNKDDMDNDKVEPLALNMNFSSEYFKGQTILALKMIAAKDGPFLIHCTEGKDRTGFMCLLLEALAGATYYEIVEDYMMTYFNYYAITKAFDEQRYTTIVNSVLNPMIETIVGQNINLNSNTVIEEYATAYIKQNGAMTDGEVVALKSAICNP